MKITVVGTGYVGLVTGTCFAEVGIDTTCVDIDIEKIENLKKGISPIFEPGLDTLIQRNLVKNHLHFSTDLGSCVNYSEVVFIAVGTPPDEDGSADLKYVIEVAKSIGKSINDYLLIITKSTVPVGTANKVREAIEDEQLMRGVKIDFDVASNPEFLKEGTAIDDFMRPERIVIGVESDKAE
jgi:UDPglucose 6-dehydrogenase